MAKRWISHLMVMFAFALLAGCVPSLNPLYTDADLVFDPKLIGTWAESDDAMETWRFQEAHKGAGKETAHKEYRLVVTDCGRTGHFYANLLRIDGKLFLDFYPDVEFLDQLNANWLYTDHLMPVHTFAKVDQIEPTLKMAFMSPEALASLLETHPRAVHHATHVNGGVLLTAPPKDLQRFVLEHVTVLFTGPSDLKRIKPRF